MFQISILLSLYVSSQKTASLPAVKAAVSGVNNVDDDDDIGDGDGLW